MEQHCVEQYYIENHFYGFNRMLLSVINLWPYDNESIYIKINRIFILAMSLSLFCVQLTTFLTFEFTVNLIIAVLSNALPCLICIVQYYFFYVNLDKVKQIWKCICEDYNALKDETERKIIRRYSHIATHRTIRVTVLISMGLTAYVFLEFSPIILDIVLPLTEIRPRKLHILTEYFVDDEKYFYPILCHWLSGVFLNFFIIVSTCMFQTAYGEHICGLFKIACYRIQHSIDKYADANSQIDDHITVQRISSAVQMHRKALEHAEFWISTFTTCVTAAVILWVVSLSINLFQLLKFVISLEENLQEMIKLMMVAMIIIFHLIVMFLGNYYAQNITSHHDKIFKNACNLRWYGASIKIQKLLLFIMVKTKKTYTININKIFICSLETFTKITNISVSYFMLLHSLIKYNVQWHNVSIKTQKLLLLIMTKTTKIYAINISNIFLASLESFTKITSTSISYFMALYSLMK